MTVSNDYKQIRDGFEISTHAFLNSVSRMLQKRLQQEVDGAVVEYRSKRQIGTLLEAEVLMTVIDHDENIAERVRQVMEKLRSPSNFLSAVAED